MPPVVIENPILNSPFEEPERHFRFSDDGITDEVAEGWRESGYFLPIASPRKKSGQMKFDTEWTQDRFLSSPRINRIRERVKQWRQGGHVGVTRTTARLLEYWGDPSRERRLFFCQREALETAIYITEVAEGSPAAAAGLQAGDILTQIGEVALDESHPFINALWNHAAGETIPVKFVRGSETRTVSITLGERPHS